MSDVHLEFAKMPKSYKPPECDVLILAGDIAPGRQGMAWAMTLPQDLPILYICGNHEFYGRSFRLLDELRAKADATPNIKLLENNSFELGGCMFIGATLWTDFNLFGDPVTDAMIARNGMSDFRWIEGMDVQVWLDRNAFSRDYIEGCVARALAKGLCPIVATHHGPDEGSTAPQFAQGKWAALNPCYMSHTLREMPEQTRPALWLHGHVHNSFDYMVGRTRVMTNPRGYVQHDLNPKFDPHIVVDIDPAAWLMSRNEEQTA